VYQDAFDSVKQKYSSALIFEIPMTKGSEEPAPMGVVLSDIWEKVADMEEQIFMNENPMEMKVRGNSFS
jgi:hypothetical protein